MIDEYLKARKAAEKEYKARLAKGEYPYLPALDDILPENGMMKQVRLGMMEIPVEFAIGTKTRARQNSFAPDFMPLLEPDTEFAMKWANLYNAQMEEGFNSPIKAYEYLHRFYVQEGNKRVSVSKFLDMPTIMADVMRILPEDAVLAEHPAYAEFLDFYRVCPIYDIECSVPGSYKEIAELLGQSISHDAGAWPEDLVRSLQSAFWRFSRLSEDLIEDLKDMTVGDAFVIYLRIYVRDALDNTTDKELDKRLKRIRKELMTAANTESVSLVESSDEALSAGGLITKTGGLITKPGSIIGKVIPSISYSAKHPLKAAFIYDKDPATSNWIYNHEAGRLRLEKAYGGIVSTARFITGEDQQHYPDFGSAVAAAADWGADVVFTPSVRQMTDTLRAAIDYKDIKFLNCSINLAHQAVRTYYAKLYEAKFLAGIVAASEAVRNGSHKIGYFSDYPIYGTIAAINAFAIGAAMIDPAAEIHLEWTTKQAADWWKVMRDEGISVISAVDSTHPADGSQAYGVFHIDEDGNIRHLAAPIWKWGKLYEIIIKTVLEGNYNASLVDKKDQATNYWWGMISGVVDIQLEDTLSPYTRQLVEILKSDIIFGVFNPFDGELRSQDGWIRRDGDPLLTSKDIISMNWLNENIIGEIPEKDTLREEARETVKVSGVK